MNTVNTHISKKLKKLRKEKKLTHDELAMSLGFKARQSIIYLEQGKQSFTAKTIYMICCVFNITPNELFPPIKYRKRV